MKKILLLLVALLCISSCSGVEPIYSLSQLEPALRKHIGAPTTVHTVYKKPPHSENSISFYYDDVTEGSFEKFVSFLSEAYNCEPVLTSTAERKRAGFVPLSKEDGIYMVQLSEWIKNGRRDIILSVLDVKDELVPPSSSSSGTGFKTPTN